MIELNTKVAESPRRPRFSREQKQQIVATVRERQRVERRHVGELVREAGVSLPTFYKWSRELGDGNATPFRPVSLLQSYTGAVLVTPTGFRVEGLALQELAALLRLLG
jgi:transposase-like protein